MTLPATVHAGGTVLDVRDLRVNLRTGHGEFPVVREVSLSVAAGETVCLVGESGCGKSMTALSLLRLLPEAARIAHGEIRLEGEDLVAASRRRVEDLRGDRIAMIFQEPLTSLNPVMKIGDQIAESIVRHERIGRRAAWGRAVERLRLVQMPDPERRAGQYPHQLSGGMRQRAMIALALACDPAVIIADEPTTALDVTIQAQILDLIADLQSRTGTALILITHDLGVVHDVADRVMVMYAGRIVEEALAEDLFAEPLHPYTARLMRAAAAVEADSDGQERLEEIPGTVPPIWELSEGCAFAPRCHLTTPRCRTEDPPLEGKRQGRRVACWEVGHG